MNRPPLTSPGWKSTGCNRDLRSTRRQRGAVLILVALLLPVLLGLCALAVDVALVFLVRNELQNVADAAALSGAAKLYSGEGGPIDEPNFSAAASTAGEAITLNRSIGVELEDVTVASGFWPVHGADGPPVLTTNPGPRDVPALQVTIWRGEGANGGAVPLHFARALGLSSLAVSASAVAAVAPVAAVGAGEVFPLVVTECLYQQYWNAAASPPGPKLDPSTGLPYVLRIGADYTYQGCKAGSVSSLESDVSNLASLQALLTSRNASLLKYGSRVWLQPSFDESFFASIEACSGGGNGQCTQVVVPVVGNAEGHSQVAITAFACLNIQRASWGGENYIQVAMTRNCIARNAGGAGINYGVLGSARLVL